MTEENFIYLENLTNAYTTRGGEVRRMYSMNMHRPFPCAFYGFSNTEYYSQEYQDFVIDVLFKGMRNGVFVDIGANHPTYINNTYFLEKERGWQGLAFEPNHNKQKLWECRSTECLPFALSNYNGKEEYVQFVSEYDYMSGFKNTVAYEGEIESITDVTVCTLSEILKERNITHVDYISLDVEGAELKVLQGIDFSQVDITAFTIELDDAKEAYDVRKFMIEKGYRFGGRLWVDDLWIKDDYVLTEYDDELRKKRYLDYINGI